MGRSSAARPDPRRARAVTREQLLATAEEVFFARGFAESSVDAVAAAAGYTTGAVYSNFGGKGDLFLAVLERVTSRELEQVRAALDAARTDEQRLNVFSTAIAGDPARWQARVAATLEFLSYARRRPELHARMVAAQRVADEAMGELLAAICRSLGIVVPAPADGIVRDVTAIVNGLSVRALFDDELDLATAVPRAINALLTGERTQQLPAPGRRPAVARRRRERSSATR